MFLYPPRSLQGPGCGSNMIREVDPRLIWHFQWMTLTPSDNGYSSHTAPLDNVHHHQVIAAACTRRRFVTVAQHLCHLTPLSPNASITQCLHHPMPPSPNASITQCLHHPMPLHHARKSLFLSLHHSPSLSLHH